MNILINNPVFETLIFSAVLFLALFISARRRKDQEFFPVSVSQELKGLAILAIVFAHVAYGLASGTRFLSPLSTIAGIGVDLFLLLSGYGLVVSTLKKPLGILTFYKKRLTNLYLPFWICLALFFILDYFFFNLNYGWAYIGKSFLGFFNRADLILDVNSPFWYFSWIAMYYLLFPLLFIKKMPWLSAILLYLGPLFLVDLELNIFKDVAHLHRLHLIAFPLGVFLGWLLNASNLWERVKILWRAKSQKISLGQKEGVRATLLIVLIFSLYYLLSHSLVGEQPIVEELFSILSSLLFLAIFLLKRMEIRLLYLFGVFSYGIYIFHWPMMFRYDFLFKTLPPWLALIIYLAIFLGLGYLLEKLVAKINSKLFK